MPTKRQAAGGGGTTKGVDTPFCTVCVYFAIFLPKRSNATLQTIFLILVDVGYENLRKTKDGDGRVRAKARKFSRSPGRFQVASAAQELR